MKSLKLFCVVVLAAVVTPCLVQAGSISGPFDATASIPFTSTEWSSGSNGVNYLTFPKFDSSLGLLESVQLSYSGSMNTTITVTNFSGYLGSPSDSSGTVSTQSVVSIQDASNDLVSPLSKLAILSSPQAYTLSGSVGNNTESFVDAETTMSDTFTYTAPAVLADFNGPGSIQLAAATSTGSVYTNTGGETFPSQVSSVALTGTVTYTYAPLPVPEPTAFALLSVGVVGLMGYVWRRKRLA